MRRLYGHAFTDTALLEQAPLLTRYFDLLVTKLKKKIDGPEQGRVDIMAFYNFTTFDIVGFVDLLKHEEKLKHWIETSHLASLLAPWRLASIMHGSSCCTGFSSSSSTDCNRNIIVTFQFLGILRCATIYPAMNFCLKVLKVVMPSFEAKRNAHLTFTKAKVEKRLDQKTDRKDFMTYVRHHISCLSADPPDMLKILKHNDERGMTREEIIGTSRVLLIAGSETTATLLGGATYQLLRNPAVMCRVQSEVRNAFKEASDITLRAVSTPGLLPYLEAVLQETLRYRPPVPANLPRKVGPSGAIIEGSFVPANVIGILPLQLSSSRGEADSSSHRYPWASTNGRPTAAAPISHSLIPLTLNASSLLLRRNTVTITMPPCSLSPWDQEAV